MNATPQFLAPTVRPDEDELERSLRPRSLDDFVGQTRVKEQLAIALEAARSRGEALDHVLLVGPPGLGKTSLAYIVREELAVTGYGRAEKAQVQRMVQAILRLDAPPAPHHAADALAVAICHAMAPELLRATG